MLDRLAAFAVEDSEKLPPRVVDRVKCAVLDYLGVAVAAAREPLVGPVLATLARPAGAGDPSATVLGVGAALVPRDAALANGMLGHLLDYDDTSRAVGGHPSTVLVPALLAVGEARGVDGSRLIDAYAHGFEVAAALGRAMATALFEKGWHPTSVLGALGATVGICRLTGSSLDVTRHALAIAAAQLGGIRAAFGTPMKSLQVGRAASIAVGAWELASRGVEGPLAVLDPGPEFIFRLLTGSDQLEARAVAEIEQLGERWELEERGIVFKRYPCCASTHTALDLMDDIVKAHGLSWDAIERVDCRMPRIRLLHTDRPRPTTPLEAKFSVQYCLAVMAKNRSVRRDDFSPERLADADIQRLLARIEAKPLTQAELDELGGHEFACRIEVVTRDGTVIRGEKLGPKGGPDSPLRFEELIPKFLDNVGSGVGEKAAALLERLESLDNVQRLIGLLAPSARAA